MSSELFRRGGPYNIQKTGRDQYSFNVSLPPDGDGRIARECLHEQCSPGYFKVKNGTGITGNHTEAFCPYCRNSAEPSDFSTKEQIRYAKDIVTREAEKSVVTMMKDALGLDSSGRRKLGGGFLSIEMSMKEDSPRYVRRPFEEDLLRAVVCPHCGLDHAVFGLATWCADCGADIFMEHVKAEYDVVRSMLTDIERRRSDLGPRIAARDIENCLEDVVSIFEAVLKAMLSRHLRTAGESEENIHALFKDRIRNGFQNPKRAMEIIKNRTQQELFDGIPAEAVEQLNVTFDKRHPITHNLGVVDRKYLENAYAAEREGREIRVPEEEIERAIAASFDALSSLHLRLFQETP